VARVHHFDLPVAKSTATAERVAAIHNFERREGVPSARQLRDAELAEKIKAIHTESKCAYGARGSQRVPHPQAETARDLIQRHFGPCEEMDGRRVGDNPSKPSVKPDQVQRGVHRWQWN
jgi:hypothetical protein